MNFWSCNCWKLWWRRSESRASLLHFTGRRAPGIRNPDVSEIMSEIFGNILFNKSLRLKLTCGDETTTIINYLYSPRHSTSRYEASARAGIWISETARAADAASYKQLLQFFNSDWWQRQHMLQSNAQYINNFISWIQHRFKLCRRKERKFPSVTVNNLLYSQETKLSQYATRTYRKRKCQAKVR